MFDAGAIVGRLQLNTDHWKRNIDLAKKDTRSFNGYVARNTDNIRKMGLALTGVGVILTGVTGKLTAMASEAVESENLFTESMGAMAASTRKWSEEFSTAVGVNSFEVRKMVGTFNVMMGSMGIAEKSAESMSQSLTQLAYDMSSFYNLRVEEAFTKLQAGISGEVEPLKRLGIIVNETTIKNWALTKGIIKQGQEMTEAQKVIARYGVIMEQTSVAQGDLARTSGTLSNLSKRVKSNFEEVGILLGQTMIPLATKFVQTLNDMVVKLKEGIKNNNRLVSVIMHLAAAFGIAATVAGTLMLSMVALNGVMAALNITAGGLLLMFSKITIAVMLVYAAWKHWDLMRATFWSFAQGVNQVIITLLESFQKLFNYLNGLSGGQRLLAAAIPGVAPFLELAKVADEKLGETLDSLRELDGFIGKRATRAFSDWQKSGEDAMTGIESKAQSMADRMKAIFDQMAESQESILERFRKAFDREYDMIEGIADHTYNAMSQLWTDVFYKTFTGRLKDAGDAFQAFGEMVLKGLAEILAQWVTMQALSGAKSLGSAIFKGALSVGGAALGAAGSLGSASSSAGMFSNFGIAGQGADLATQYYGFAGGIDQVPQTGLYRLHAGEEVVPKYDARKDSGSVVEIHNLITPEAVAAAMQSREGEGVIINVINRDSLRNGVTRREIFRR